MGAYTGANLASHKALDLGDVSPDRGQLRIKKSKFTDICQTHRLYRGDCVKIWPYF